MFGLNDAEIAAILRGEFEKFAASEQALLRMADALADTPAHVSDELYSDLRKHFSEEQLIEFAADAGQENFRARANRLFNVGSDSLYCALPGP
jgi:alkylhydroperoxidase family enzyme